MCPLIDKWRAEMSISAPRKSVEWHEWELWRINSTSILCLLPSNLESTWLFTVCGSPYEHVPIKSVPRFSLWSDSPKFRCHLLRATFTLRNVRLWYWNGGGNLTTKCLGGQSFTRNLFKWYLYEVSVGNLVCKINLACSGESIWWKSIFGLAFYSHLWLHYLFYDRGSLPDHVKNCWICCECQ